MPYQLPDPSQSAVQPMPPVPSGPAPSLEELAVLADPAAFRSQLEQLRGPIARAAQQAEEEATATVTASEEYGVLSRAGASLGDVWRAYDAAVTAAGRDLNLSAKGRNDAVARAKASRDAGTNRIAETVLSDYGDRLLARFPATPAAVMPPDVATIASYTITAAESMLPATFLTKALDALRRASDPATPSADRQRLNWLLDGAYGPLLDRFGGAPPKYWGSLSGVAADVAALVRQYIATAWGNAKADVAASAVARFRADFTSLVRMAEGQGRWDDFVAQIATPVFAWPGQSRTVAAS